MNMKYALMASLIIVLILLSLSYLLTYYKAGTAAHTNQKFSQSFCLNAAQNSTAMDAAVDNGINCFRTDISFNKSEIGFIANRSESGAHYLGILDYQTVGAQPSPSGCISGCNWTLADWNASVSNAIAAYPEINTWEIWNEPLVGIFSSGYENGSALNYFNMIKSAYTIIKSSEPNSTVVCFGGADFSDADFQFYSQVWSYGASSYCDAISIHVYTDPYYNLNQTIYGQTTLGQEFNFALNSYENLTEKPIWITETGIPSNNGTGWTNLSEQRQASFLTEDLNFFASYPFVRRIYWFHLVGYAGGSDYGLLNATTMNPQPAWYSFIGFVHSSTNSNR